MSDLYRARLAATYTPAGGEPITICRYGDILIEPPAYEWSAATQSADIIGADWGRDMPRGNVRRTMTIDAAIAMPTVAQLERTIRAREIAVNTHRAGTMTIAEAWHDGVPTLTTRWVAVVTTCTGGPLDLDAAPGGLALRNCCQPMSAWGSMRYEIILTHPVTI